ncbi:MAG TPA: hypothetical protein VJK52_05570 [Candidatus Nanoarchaeia archaeon]|nr:hypothetical protein [Candidatus Nanoarchaeia archaeon]
MPQLNLRDRVQRLYHSTFNAKFALISAACNGPIAAAVNAQHGPGEALAAGLSQAISSFLSTGVTARVVQHFSPMENRFVSYFFGSLIPATMTFGLSYAAHHINGTPEQLESCIAPTVISYSTSYVTNYITRRGHLLPGNYPMKTS